MKNLGILFSLLLLCSAARGQSSGAIQVNGQPGKFQIFQKVKAVRCSENQRGVCDAPVFFDLNKQQLVPPGSYLVGFENSLHPELVQVRSGLATTINLERISVPSQVRGAKILVYRDFTSLVEQRKIYLSMFTMNRHFFRLDSRNFGSLYLTGSWERDFVQRFTYETCPRIDSLTNASDSAKSVCTAWNTAQRPSDLRDLYNFANDGTFQEMWVTFPGDTNPSKHPRYLVSAPMTTQDFVAVFPGVYKVQAEGRNNPAITVRAGNVSQYERSLGISLNAVGSLSTVSKESCAATRMWKTESRAYCTSDSQEGCNRSNSESCEAM